MRRPKPVAVMLPDGQPYVIKRLLSLANGRQDRGKGYFSVGLTLTPATSGRSGRNLCLHATRGCVSSCFADVGRLAWPQNKKAAVARTLFLVREPGMFMDMLRADLSKELKTRHPAGVPPECCFRHSLGTGIS